jgi:prepilin-type N-terminal cleavage/methylation domain-containing protein
MRNRLRDARGLTLTEVMVVLVLATMVMSGLVGFYLSSQSVWFSGSSKAIAQREASLVLKSISDRARPDSVAIASATANPNFWRLDLVPYGKLPSDSTYSYWWDPADSLIHEGYKSPTLVDRGPMLRSKVERFQISVSGQMVNITSLRVHTTQGDRIDLATSVALVAQ